MRLINEKFQIERKRKRRKAFVFSLLCFALLAAAWPFLPAYEDLRMAVERVLFGHPEAGREGDLSQEALAARQVDVVLKQTYACGVEVEERRNVTFASEEALRRAYGDWELVSVDRGNAYVFRRSVQDISPLCKESGYFGLSADGILTLFQGPPKDGKIIRAFFPINTKKLESMLPQQEIAMLYKGIRIRDLAEYNSVLSTYEEFALE
ncbi:hypothetical protein BSNK01_03640 [Bacillaceae bacterium]